MVSHRDTTPSLHQNTHCHRTARCLDKCGLHRHSQARETGNDKHGSNIAWVEPCSQTWVSVKESPEQLSRCKDHVTTQYGWQARSPGDLNTGSRPSLGCCIRVSNSDITAGFKKFYAQYILGKKFGGEQTSLLSLDKLRALVLLASL